LRRWKKLTRLSCWIKYRVARSNVNTTSTNQTNACYHIPTYVLVERGSRVKHETHVSHTGHIPGRDVLVERGSLVKHVIHLSHTGHIPGRDVLVERGSRAKHETHASHTGHIPGRDVLVERGSRLKHPTHVSHTGHIPGRDVAIGRGVATHPRVHCRSQLAAAAGLKHTRTQPAAQQQ
jgi:hypothetical protein